MRDGQKVTIYDGGVATLTGKRGTLTIRDRNEWVDSRATEWRRSGRRHRHRDLEGRARDRPVRRDRREGAGWPVGLGSPWYARYEGFLTAGEAGTNEAARQSGFHHARVEGKEIARSVCSCITRPTDRNPGC